MKKLLSILICLGSWYTGLPQDEGGLEQQLETIASEEETDIENDESLQRWELLKRQPLNLNKAVEEDLAGLPGVSVLQVISLIRYRRLAGELVDLFELQAVPLWDLVTIRRILPFVTVKSPAPIGEDGLKRFKGGTHQVLIRVSQVLERSKGYRENGTDNSFLGSPQKLFFRYRYNYKDRLQYGILGEKDAGEQFFRGAQRSGFDFYSLHLFAKKLGPFAAIALGDYTVNMGQGLIHWQGMGFRKGAEVININRQSPVLKPYNSAGEFYFHRGAGMTVQAGRTQTTFFISSRKLNANLQAETGVDSRAFTSLLTSGNNRTPGELNDKNRVHELVTGFNIRYTMNSWQIGINGILHHYSLPLQKNDEAYNRLAISGSEWANFSIEHSWTWKNVYIFGETAIDRRGATASVQGMLISVDSRIELSFLNRTIPAKYQAIDASAFTENTSPNNERGFYWGIRVRPTDAWRLDAYADIARFPWLKFRVDAPSRDYDYFVECSYTLNRQAEFYLRYKSEVKQGNGPGRDNAVRELADITRNSMRFHFNYVLNRSLSFRTRFETVGYGGRGLPLSHGFLAFFDLAYKPQGKGYAAMIRLQQFETEDYDSRVYAYENDVMYSYSIPAFYGKGLRYYINWSSDLGRAITVWIRWSQSIQAVDGNLGSGPDELGGRCKSELKLQLRVRW